MTDTSVININVCGICLSGFVKPKILPCFHTFCLKCLQTNVKINGEDHVFTCPMCRKMTQIPEGGMEHLQDNFYLEAGVRPDLKYDCDVCEQIKVARYECFDCKQKFCDACMKAHSNMTVSRSHEVVIIPTEDNSKRKDLSCIEHDRETVSHVCKVCDKMVCSICVSNVHRDHTCVEVSTEANEKRIELAKLLEKSEDNHHELQKDINVMKKQSESKYIYFNEQIESMRKEKDNIIEKVNEMFEKHETEIKRLNEEQLIKAKEIFDVRGGVAESFKQTIDEVKHKLEAADDIKVLRDFEEVSARLNEIEFTLTPSVSGHGLMEKVEQCTCWLLKVERQTEQH